MQRLIRPRRRGRTLAGALILLALLPAGAAAAPELPFDDTEEQRYRLDAEPLPGFLRRFFREQGVPVELSNQLQNADRMLSGIRGGTAQEVFRSIVRTNRLSYFYDGQTIYLYENSEVSSEYVRVSPDRLDTLQRALGDISSPDDDNVYSVVEDGLVRVRGVPEYVDQVRQLARAIGQGPAQEEVTFRFFPLEYAWASDRRFTAGNRTAVVPGVASILRQLVQGASGKAASVTATGGVQGSGSQRSLRGEGLARRDDGDVQDAASRLAAVTGGESGGSQSGGSSGSSGLIPSGSDSGPMIVPAPYGNGIIVRDEAERMPLYRRLIDALDVEPKVVEIQATIINVNIDKLERLGTEFRVADDDTEGVFGEAGSKANFLQALGANNVSALNQVPGFQLGAIIDSEEPIVARINALEQEGAVDIVSRPTVLTINGLEAVVESSQKIFVPVEGAFEVDLFDVFAGTVLRVTPHVVDGGSKRKIRLFLSVDDGEVQRDTAEGDPSGRTVPTVTRNSVTSQALIRDGQSLLVGGLIEERASTNTRKVPLLGDIPLVGALFRSKTESKDRFERLFLIRPRVVDPDRMARGLQEQSIPTASQEALDEFEGSPTGAENGGGSPGNNGNSTRTRDDDRTEQADTGGDARPRPSRLP